MCHGRLVMLTSDSLCDKLCNLFCRMLMSKQSNLQGMSHCMSSKQQRRGQHRRAGRWSLRRSRMSFWMTTETSGVSPANFCHGGEFQKLC